MVLKFYGVDPPNAINNLRPGGVCPHCKTATRFALSTVPIFGILHDDRAHSFVASYACDHCMQPIPIRWHIFSWNGQTPVVGDATVVVPSREPFEFNHVPEAVSHEIEEALDCLSVNAYNGFAAVCRRSIQAICVNLGADASTKVQKQIEEMIDATGLGDEWKSLAIQIMLSGHDGAHPHLPDVNQDRASILLSLLGDLCYQLYTRPGNIKQAAQLRKSAIEAKQK
jgi:hypothetical protein